MARTDFGRQYFSKPPHKSFYFWTATIWLLVVLGMVVLFGKHYYGRLGSGEVGGGLWWISLAAAAPIILWLRAWQSHAKLHEMSLGNDSESGDQASVDSILTEAAYLENTGLGITLFVLMSALMAIVRILPK